MCMQSVGRDGQVAMYRAENMSQVDLGDYMAKPMVMVLGQRGTSRTIIKLRHSS